MLTANLLPPEEKNIVRLGGVRRLIYFFASAGTAVFLVGSVLLLPSYFLSRSAVAALKRLRASEEDAASLAHLSRTIGAIRSSAASVDRIKAFGVSRAKAGVLLENLLHVPAGIAIESIAVKKDGSTAISGIAATRASLLAFERILRDAGRFENIAIPLSSIIQEDTIHFTVQGVLKPPYRL